MADQNFADVKFTLRNGIKMPAVGCKYLFIIQINGMASCFEVDYYMIHVYIEIRERT